MDEDLKKYYDLAVNFCRDRLELDLDNSDDSIISIESFSDSLMATSAPNKEAFEQIQYSKALSFGIYIGETLRVNHYPTAIWKTSENGQTCSPFLLCGKVGIHPVDRMYRRLTSEPKDSLVDFYQSAIRMVRNQ